MTVTDLIKGSARQVGALGIGQGLSASALADGLFSLNAMIGNWNTQRLLIFTTSEAQYTLESGVQSYTIGPAAADFTAPRPHRVESARCVVDGERYPVEVVQEDRWSRIGRRSETGQRPEVLYPEMRMPLVTLHVWPVPDAAGVELELSTWQALEKFATVNDEIVLPDGYDHALLYNLAVELAPQFPQAQLSQMVVDQARESRAWLKRMNAVHLEMSCDSALLDNRIDWDWRTGDYRR